MTFSRRNSALEPEEKEQGIDGIKMIIDTSFIQLRYTDVLGKFLAKYVFENKETFDSFFTLASTVGGETSISSANLLYESLASESSFPSILTSVSSIAIKFIDN